MEIKSGIVNKEVFNIPAQRSIDWQVMVITKRPEFSFKL